MTPDAETIELLLGPTQFDVLSGLSSDEFDIGFMVGGRGAGKSTALGLFIDEMKELEGSVGLLTAPVLDTVNNSTLPGVLEVWRQIGLEEGRDFVFGAPPPSWGVRPYQRLRNMKIITWRTGSYTILDGSDNFAKHRGIELDYVAIDELGNLKQGALEVYIGGLRGKATKKAGLHQKVFGVGNPPEDPYDIERWQGLPGVRVFLVSTYENRKNLPAGYIERMADTFDRITFAREVKGDLVALGGMKAISEFTPAPFPAGNLTSIVLDPKRNITITCDFNASQTRPMSWLVGQSHRMPNGQTIDVVVMEFVNPGTSSRAQAKIVREWLEARQFRGVIEIRGDATGGDAARNSANAQSDYAEMQRVLKHEKWSVEPPKTRRTRRVKDRIAALNSRLCTESGVRRMAINGATCPATIEAIKRLRWKENGYELEDNAFKDPVDALSYWPYYDSPVHRKEKTSETR